MRDSSSITALGALAQVCPIWPGQPITAHWGAADPAAFIGSDEATRRFFMRIYSELENRIKLFTSLPIDSLDRFALECRAREIGRAKPPEEPEQSSYYARTL